MLVNRIVIKYYTEFLVLPNKISFFRKIYNLIYSGVTGFWRKKKKITVVNILVSGK